MSTPTGPTAPAREFNSPPNWPPCPPGWVPEPGWQPDPSWGPAPEGWQWWRPATMQPPAGPTRTPAMGEAQRAAHAHAQSSARNAYLAGVGVTVAAAVTTLVAASKGGTIWTGGFIFGALLWLRAGRSTVLLHRSGTKLGRRAVVVVGITAPLTLILAGIAAGDLLHMQRERPSSSDPDRNSVGSCWAQRGSGKVANVACSAGDATLIVTSTALDPLQCGPHALSRPGYYLCLSPR